eukprot:IDg14959t1
MNQITAEDSKWMALNGDITRIMHRIAENINDESIRRVAVMCLASNAPDRPTMDAVVKTLEEVKCPKQKSGSVLSMEKAAIEDNCEAARWFESASRGGHSQAKRSLADCYRLGVGVKKDLEKAALLYESAAHAGDLESKGLLGYCYMRGYGVQRNFSKAIQLYKEASDAGCPQAQYNL